MSILEEIQKMKQNPHCANCGELNPECVDYGDSYNKGYTLCCDEAVCISQEYYYFGNDSVKVKACCWAVAEREFKSQGINHLSLDSMSRIPVDGMGENL